MYSDEDLEEFKNPTNDNVEEEDDNSRYEGDEQEEQDGQEGSSKAEDIIDKLNDAKEKFQEAKDRYDELTNKNSKSASPDGVDEKEGNKTNSDTSASTDSGGNTATKSEEKAGENTSKTESSSAETGKATTSTGGTNATTSMGENTANGAMGATTGETATAAGEGAAAEATAATAGGSAAAGESAAAVAVTPVGWILLIVLIVIIIIMIIIGAITFLIDGVGIISEKIKTVVGDIWDGIEATVIGTARANLEMEDMVSVANYLEDMGYDLEGFGFLDTNGKGITIEDTEDKEGNPIRIYKNSEGATVLERKLIKSGEGVTEGDITKVKSECIWSYLVANEQTYMTANQYMSIPDFFTNLIGNHDDINGLIYCEDIDPLNMVIPLNNFHVDVDKEGKKLFIAAYDDFFSWNPYVYVYDIDGWSGRYGKPIEFLLTLHLATMSPDFAEAVATKPEFNTKVHIKLKEVEADITLVRPDPEEEGSYIPITEDNYTEFGFNEEQWKMINDYNTTPEEPIKTYTPYIEKVENHWFKNLDFTNCYQEIENDPTTSEDDEIFTSVYPYVGLGEDDDMLAAWDLYIKEVRRSDIRQNGEPKVIYNDSKIKELLLGGEEENANTNENYKYYMYNGVPLKTDGERPKRYIVQALSTGIDKEYIMDTRPFEYAFAILESVHSQDAEYILRDLKELFTRIGIDTEQGVSEDIKIDGLKWIIPEYVSLNMDVSATDSILIINAKTEEKEGFDEGKKIVMPAKAEITNIVNDSDENEESKTVRITFTEGDLKGISMYIIGISVNSDIKEGDILEAEKEIGKTTKEDIRVIMKDKNQSTIANVGKYLHP